MTQPDLDASEAATPHKLHQARKQGRVPRSAELVAAAVLLAAVAYAAGHGLPDALRVAAMVREALQGAAQADPVTQLWPLLTRLLQQAAGAVLPFMGVLMAAAVLATLAQTGVVCTVHPLKPDFSRLHPARGLQRLLSRRTLYDAARACAKLALLVTAAALALQALVPQWAALSAASPGRFLQQLVHHVARLGGILALLLALIAWADLAYTRREFSRHMRMSRRELKDEIRHREGDPRIRARLRQLRRERLRRGQALRNTRQADVVLANPTHYAVALRYVHGQMDAPRLLAKGAGAQAAAMREIARRHHIPVVHSPGLTRRLFRALEIDQLLPSAFHPEVARIMVWVFATRALRAAPPQAAAGAPT